MTTTRQLWESADSALSAALADLHRANDARDHAYSAKPTDRTLQLAATSACVHAEDTYRVARKRWSEAANAVNREEFPV